MIRILAEATTVTWSSLSSFFTAITNQFTVANVLGVLAGAMGIAIVFVFLWFGIKKGLAILKPAMNSGTLSSGGGRRRR